MQIIYQILNAHFKDGCADESTNEPVMTAVLDKAALVSQPILSRFFHCMDEDTLARFNIIIWELRNVIYCLYKGVITFTLRRYL